MKKFNENGDFKIINLLTNKVFYDAIKILVN